MARRPCPKGEYLSKTQPVVCVPNKAANQEGEPFPPFPYDISSILWLAVLVAFVVLAARKLARWRVKSYGITQTVAGLSDPLPVGNLVQSPTLGPGGLGWIDGRQALPPRDRLNLHVLVAGATGSGKSTTVDRIEYEAVGAYRPQVIHFDCKGRRNVAARFLALMLRAYEEHEIRVAPIEPYDGFMHYIAERKDPDRDVLLVLDDFSAISAGDEAVNLAASSPTKRAHCPRVTHS